MDQREDFVRALLIEIAELEGHLFTEEVVRSVYFGGGTPSLLTSDQLGRIMNELQRVFTLEVDELTIEMNPDNVTPDYLMSLKAFGFDRISMGVQSFSEKSLSFMNRAHNREQALQALDDIVASSFKNYTVDLIYGQPNQTKSELQEDIDQLMEFNPPHISAYALTIEHNTRLAKQVELGKVKLAGDDHVVDQMDLLAESLKNYSLYRYEVSSFAKDGFQAKHNQIYWNHGNYIGLGPGAHSFWWPKSSVEKKRLIGIQGGFFKGFSSENEVAFRWSNPKDLMSYIYNKNDYQLKIRTLIEPVNESSLAEEYIWLGLRTSKGFDRSILSDLYKYYFNTKQHVRLKQLLKDGKISQSGNRFSLTTDGVRIADYIALDLLS